MADDRVITDPKEIKHLKPGKYVLSGEAAEKVVGDHLRSIIRQNNLPHKPGNNGFGLCPHCGRPVHWVGWSWLNNTAEAKRQRAALGIAEGYYRHNPIPRLKVIPDRERTHCSKCGKGPLPGYMFKPGSGECTECQT